MDVTIHGHEMKITESVEEYTQAKLDRLDRYLPNIDSVRVDLSVQNTYRGANLAIAQITLRHSRGAIIRAEEKLPIKDRDTIKTAINKAADKIYRQIGRFKTKRRSKQVRERYAATLEELRIAEALPDDIDIEEEVVELEEEIVRRKEIAVSPMNEEEAIEQMELIGHDFFVFFNSSTNSVNVLYKRENAGYGVLVPLIE